MRLGDGQLCLQKLIATLELLEVEVIHSNERGVEENDVRVQNTYDLY